MLRATLIVMLLLTACGDESGSEPVEVTLGNLDGYWVVSSPAPWGPRPGLLHIGFTPYPGELPEGVTRAAETVLFDGKGQVATYELTGSTLQLDAADWSGTLEIESLTRDTMVARYGGETVTLTRQSDCAGPGFWMSADAQVNDAAWDQFGGLHLIAIAGDRAAYGWVAPGRCVVTMPEMRIAAATIDIADNGDVRLLNYARSGALPGEITVTTVPAKPWTRDTLESSRKIYPAASTPANDPPPLRSIEIDGVLTIFYAYASQLFAVTDAGETTLSLSTSSTFTPGLLTITHLPDGSWVIREGNNREGLRYVDGAYERWSAERVAEGGPFASVFAYDGTTLYAAWSETYGYPAIIVGKKVGDEWQRVTAGQGYPIAIHVEDGVIDVVGSLDVQGLGPMAWSRLPRFAENVWSQEYQLSFTGSINAVTPRNTAAGALFGPNGEVFMAVLNAVWRRPNAEKPGETYLWNEVVVTFKTETDAAVVFPTLGIRCEEACSFAAPTSALFPAVVEVPDESSASLLVGGHQTPTKDSYAIQVNTEVAYDAGPTELRVETTLRRMDPVALGVDEVQSSAGTAVAYPGGFAVTRQFAGVVLSKIEGGEVVDEVELSGNDATRVRARQAGGFVLSLTAPTLTANGVGIVSPDLELVGEVPFPDGIRGYVLTDDGFIGFRYEGPDLVFAEHTEAGATAPVVSPVWETQELAALGDGLVAFDREDKGVAPTFVGNSSQSAWRKVGLDGVVDWTLIAQRTPRLAWTVVDGDLVVATEIGPTYQIGGTTYEGATGDNPTAYFIARFDGATGAVKNHRVTSLPWGSGFAQPTDITADDEGVFVSESFAATLRLAYLPWVGEPLLRDYSADVIAGYCLQPGVQCSANRTSFAALGGGRFGGVWAQITNANYDGELITSAAKKAVAGIFVPDP